MPDKSNVYGYIGASPTQEYGVNAGIFEANDVLDLVTTGQFASPGQLEFIETKTGSGVSSIDFETLGTYDVHLLTINDMQIATDGQPLNLRFSDDGGTSYETSNYEWAAETGQHNGTFNEYKSTSATSIEIVRFNGNQTNEKANAYIYLYNLNDSSKYSYSNSHATATLEYTARYGFQFGGGVYKATSTINAFRLLAGSGNITATSISLYGVKEYV